MTESRIQRRDVLLGAAAAGWGLASGSSWADSNWPTKPVTVVVPFPAGGGTDAFARPLAAPMPLPGRWPRSFPKARARRW